MGDRMSKEQYEYIKALQDDCLECTNMTENEAWNFAFRCWQLGYKKEEQTIAQAMPERENIHALANESAKRFLDILIR